MEPGGGHRSGAGSGGAGSNKCTEVANGKHNTKIDKLLQHELNDATKCKQDCQPPTKPAGDGVAKTGQSPDTGSDGAEPHDTPRDTPLPAAPAGPGTKEASQEEDEEEEEENEEGEEEENDNVDGDGAADTKKGTHPLIHVVAKVVTNDTPWLRRRWRKYYRGRYVRKCWREVVIKVVRVLKMVKMC